MRKQHFIAAVQNDHLDHIEEVARRLRIKGCEINQILPITGIISGSIDAGQNLDELKVEGIAAIEKQRTVKKR